MNVVLSKNVQVENFALLIDLGIVTVPEGYVHRTRLGTFGKQNRKRFYYYDEKVSDENFSSPTRILRPGDRFHVRVFEQTVGGTTSSDERMAFLSVQNTVRVGAQGLSLVFEQKQHQLQKDKWYASFDEKRRLFIDQSGFNWVPGIGMHSDGAIELGVYCFQSPWELDDVFFCFNDV